jgi:protein-L-isoaspartate(D-aspartate) O-methyltransferase
MSDIDFERARFNMVEQQIRTWEVLNDRVLDILRDVPREHFVPPQYRSLSFADLKIPLPHGQVMLEPKFEARILQAVDPQPSEQVLLVGTGTGYLAACLARMAAHVTSVDIYPDINEMAQRNLSAQGVGNVTLQTGDAARGWGDERRYDVVVVTGSLPEMHRGFHHSLTIGGRLFLTVGTAPVMEALLITRLGEDQWLSESLFETVIPPLINAPVTKKFAI